MRAQVLAVVGLVVAGLTMPAAAADPPFPSEFEDSVVDERLCSFPIAVHQSGDQQIHVVTPEGQFGKAMITGPIRITLENLDTGYTVDLQPTGQGNVAFTDDTMTLYGRQILLAGGVPVAQLTGRTVARLDNFTVAEQTGTETLIDVCRLLAPETPPATARTTPAPWDAPADVFGGMALADLTPAWFGFVEHIHAHLDVIVDRASVPIPAGIGVTEPFVAANGDTLSAIDIVAPVHTHRADGVLHIENDSPPLVLTLGDFFDIWQVRLTTDCLGSYCTGDGRTLRVYVNGEQVSGDPREVVLCPAAQITVVYGRPGVPSDVPAEYAFPPGTEQFGFPTDTC
jgi:hypothetical protein